MAVVTFLALKLTFRTGAPDGEPTAAAGRLNEQSVDAAEWGKVFPVEYQGWRQGIPLPEFAEMQGHAFSLKEREETGRVRDARWRRLYAGRPKERPQPAACLHCHASVLPYYRAEGHGDVWNGFVLTSPRPFFEARRAVTQPVGCLDCHEPGSMRLRAARPAFVKARAPARSYQELRSHVCAQCHAEYYLAGAGRVVTYPWSKGLKVEEIESYYDSIGFSDWTHAETGARVLKAQHPQFEMWSQGIHARSGVACADCHMPAERRGAIYVTDHFVRSPLTNVGPACLRCHPGDAREAASRAAAIQTRTKQLLARALDALLDLYGEVQRARLAGATDAQLDAALKLQRRAQFRLDFVAEDGSQGFHAAQESARILAEAIDYARQGQLAACIIDQTSRGGVR